ncbi:MAG: hypothetical protein HYR70_04535 [Chloroflexi bacterium]|nr:hypothetical protein [Chloroflexota bacterium]MBI1856355.1 hypothetical protein [Chloroflexota bacterium]MBI3340824.1 hypothetical protein [Chloroflexota bacterium]
MQTLTRSAAMTVRQQLAAVRVAGYFYAVDLGDPVRPQHHRVGINGECTCSLGRACPAVDAVRSYLAEGGQRAERPPFGYYPVRPARCPVCHANTATAESLSSRNRGEGWICPSGKSHYWQHRATISAMRRKLVAHGKAV